MPEPTLPDVPDLPALVRAVTWQHYGRRTHLSRVEPGYRVVCGCGWESTSTAKRDEADAQHSDHLADEVRAALLSVHRDMVLGEAAGALIDAGNDPYRNAAWMYADEAAAIVRRLAATGPADGPASTEPAQNAPAVGREATEAQGSAQGDPVDRAIDYWTARAARAEADRDRVTEAAGQLHLKWLAEVADLKQRILDIDAHATPYGDIPDEPGWVGTYLVTAGALHRALGQVGHSAPKCQAEADRDRLADTIRRYGPVIEAAKAWRVEHARWERDNPYHGSSSADVVDLISAVDALGACCDMHGRNCEPPSELCCPDCTEAAHDTFPIRHADGSTCSAPDLSGNGDCEQKTAQTLASEEIHTEETT